MTGSVVTFYSYKGGVGRSFVLANVAALLARWGYRVLCVDWDIEAPGLDDYFRPWLGARERPGLVDLVTELAAGKVVDWRGYVSELPLPGAERTLELMTAGLPGPELASRVQAIDWRQLYDERKLGAYVETMRSEWKETYDLVLVDSRTGITDIGGICTVHLPDVLVLVFTANEQSLRGVKEVARMAEAQRSKLPLNRAGLLTLPVLARFDARGQDDLAKDWLRRIADELEGMYEGWLDAEISPRQFLEVSRIPYFSLWTFGERLAVLEERDNDPEGISYHLATIAALVARGLEDGAQLCRSRDSYVEVARGLRAFVERADPSSAFEYDYYVSYAKSYVELARQVATELRSAGYRVLSDSDEGRGGSLRDTFDDVSTRCQHLVVLRDAARLSKWQQFELSSFFGTEIDSTRLIYDVRLAAEVPEPDESPASAIGLARARQIDGRQMSWTGIVASILSGRARTMVDLSIDEPLRAMADRYIYYVRGDYTERTRMRDSLAAEMGSYVQTRRTSRDELAGAGHDGLAVALAEAARLAPTPGDLTRLISASLAITSSHAVFRILVAISALIERERLSELQRSALQSLIDRWRGTTAVEDPLTALIETMQRRLKNLT
jgi:cellulose biosynthesis protein BcsQ